MKILSWNVQWFRGLDGVVGVERVLEAARALGDFDVLCLQEVAEHCDGLSGGADFDQAQRVRERLPGFEVVFGAAVQERRADGRWLRFGNLVASRLPVAQAQHLPLPYPADGGRLTMPRACTSVTVQAPWGPLRVMTTHLEFGSQRIRLAQAAALADFHAQCCAHAAAPPAVDVAGSPYQAKPHTASAVLCGDFNCDTRSSEVALVARASVPPATRLVDAWPLAHPGEPQPPTFCVHEQRHLSAPLACDLHFVSEDLVPRVRGVEIDGATRVSDHQPVLLTLE